MRTCLRFPLLLLPILQVAILLPASAGAQGAGLSSTLDPSVRSAGMGSCSNAVFWDGDPDDWSNPALLGYRPGIRYEWQKTQLVPDLAPDVFFRSHRSSLGAFGVGMRFAGKPLRRLGDLRLDYGTAEAIGPGGEDLGPFRSWEEIESWGIGVSAAQLADAVLQLAGARSVSLARYADVALGYAVRRVDLDLVAPDLPGLPSGNANARLRDRGLLLRVTPYNAIDDAGYLRALDNLVRTRLDLAYGGSSLNYGYAMMGGDVLAPEPVAADSRYGMAVRLAFDWPEPLRRSWPGRLDAALDFLRPALTVGGAWDETRSRVRARGGPTTEGRAIERSGVEISVLNVFTWRQGRIDDPDGSIHGTTSGWSLGLSYRDVAGFRIDRATVPQASDPATGIRLADVKRKAWTAYVDPVRLWQRHRGQPPR